MISSLCGVSLFNYLCRTTKTYKNIMVIDFNDLDEQTIEGFKGGKGTLVTRNFADDKCKIMLSTLKPGASTGLHTHVDNCEVVMS